MYSFFVIAYYNKTPDHQGVFTTNIIMVHGGVEAPQSNAHINVLRKSAQNCYDSLNRGILEAAEEAIKVLEDDPKFNAGYGSALNLNGKVEMDASIMDGKTGKFGAVAVLSGISNPIAVARKVLENTPHSILAGKGAFEFALKNGYKEKNCISPEMQRAWEKKISFMKNGKKSDVNLFTGRDSNDAQDTVGCVICHLGNTAAASSTGGYLMKLPGRIGDTPIPGAGIIATDNCAVVCTGLGEAFIETLTASFLNSLISQGYHPQEASEKALTRLVNKRASVGGIIVIDHNMQYGACFNGRSFPVALMVNGSLIESFRPVKIP